MELAKRFFTNDNMMLVLVLINTSIIFVSGFMPSQGGGLLIVDTLFTLLFLFEALVKIRVHGFSDYWSDGWNRFDFILVLLALPSCINLFGIVFPGTNILLSLRTMRAFKTFRLLKFIPNIDNLINGIKLASKASFIVAIGLIVLLLVFSISRHSYSGILLLSISAILLSASIPSSACSLLKDGMICLRLSLQIADRLWPSLQGSTLQSFFSLVELSV